MYTNSNYYLFGVNPRESYNIFNPAFVLFEQANCMYLIIEPIVSEKLDGQLHVLQNERIIIIVIIRSNGAKTINLKNLIILMIYQKCVCIRCLNSMNIYDFSSVHQNNFLGVGSNFQFLFYICTLSIDVHYIQTSKQFFSYIMVPINRMFSIIYLH